MTMMSVLGLGESSTQPTNYALAARTCGGADTARACERGATRAGGVSNEDCPLRPGALKASHGADYVRNGY
jgi:hypothetical protein